MNLFRTMAVVVVVGVAGSAQAQGAVFVPFGDEADVLLYGLVIAVMRSGGSESVKHDRGAPVLFTGKTASGTGRRWSGLGLQVAL